MKIRGTIQGKTITMDDPINLPEGQRVEVDISLVMPAMEPPARERSYEVVRRLGITPEELDARIATEPQFEAIRRTDKIREMFLKRWGGPLNLSTQFIREDRDR